MATLACADAVPDLWWLQLDRMDSGMVMLLTSLRMDSAAKLGAATQVLRLDSRQDTRRQVIWFWQSKTSLEALAVGGLGALQSDSAEFPPVTASVIVALQHTVL